MSKKSPEKNINFEEAMKELELLVNRLEKDDLSLEDSLKTFEKGVNLTRVCQKALKDAEQEVKILLSTGEQDFKPNDEAQ